MFATLNKYGEQSYFDVHPQMYLVTPDGAYTTWLSEMAKRSVVETDVTVTSSDKVLTLSTCAPGGTTRFIVMGKLAAVTN